MRSESEISWIRVRNNVGQLTKVSDWHVIIPGLGSLDIPPGTFCGVSLSGARQSIGHSGIRNIDGPKHDVCVTAAADWIAGLDPSAPALVPEEPEQIYAAPGSSPEIR